MSVVGVLKMFLPLTVLYLMAASLFLLGAVGVLPLTRQRTGSSSAASVPGLHH